MDLFSLTEHLQFGFKLDRGCAKCCIFGSGTYLMSLLILIAADAFLVGATSSKKAKE